MEWTDSLMRRAVTWLFEQHRDRLWRSAWLLVGDEDLADDLCQDVFLTATEEPERFDGRSAPFTWLYGILLNRSRKHFRHRGVAARAHDRMPARDLTEADPSSLAQDTETRARVQAALASLPDDMRALMIMRYYEGFDGEQMAQATGLGHGRVRSRLSEARRLMKSLLVTEEPS